MRRFSAQYVYTGGQELLKRAVISTRDDGTIVTIEETGGELREHAGIEFHNGIIVPGIINCHCHLELSHLHNIIEEGTGLSGFLGSITKQRNTDPASRIKAMALADAAMGKEGVRAVADICNTADSFEIKSKSGISYFNLLEVFGFDPSKAGKRIEEIIEVAGEAEKLGLAYSFVPHSVYSVSRTLFHEILKLTKNNTVTSVHFMESEDEVLMLQSMKGPLAEAYEKLLTEGSVAEPAADHIEAVKDLMTRDGRLILVHNTFIRKEQVKQLADRNGVFYCLCPNSNLYISGTLPPVNMLIDEGCNIVLGTDSLSSNRHLSMLKEMQTIEKNFPGIPLTEILGWATENGARALGIGDWAGSIRPGMKPGLTLITGCDLRNIKLGDNARMERLI